VGGQEVASVAAHKSCVNTLAYSPDGRILASASCDHTIKLWNAATHELLGTLEGHPDMVACLAFSPKSSNQLASAGNDPIVRIWDLATREVTKTLDTKRQTIRSLVWQVDGQTLLVAAADAQVERNAVLAWDVDKNEIKTYGWDVNPIAISPSSANAYFGHVDSTIRKIGEGIIEPSVIQGHSSQVLSLAFSPREERMASGGSDRTIRIWDAKRDLCTQTLTGHMGRVQSLAFSPMSSTLASASFDGTAKLWNHVDSAQKSLTTSIYIPSGIRQGQFVAFSPDFRYVAFLSEKDRVTVLDPRERAILGTLPRAGLTKNLSFSADRLVWFGLPPPPPHWWKNGTSLSGNRYNAVAFPSAHPMGLRCWRITNLFYGSMVIIVRM
jgi:WD40 repeat protein